MKTTIATTTNKEKNNYKTSPFQNDIFIFDFGGKED